MILTCPRCATRYLVEDVEVRGDGRNVRCSNCGEQWRAFADGRTEPLETEGAEDAQEDVGAEPAEEAPPAFAPLEADFPPQPVAVEAEPDSEPEPQEARPPPLTMVSPIATDGRREGASPTLALIVLLVVGMLAAMGAVVMRDEVVRTWPATRSVYDSLGLPPSAAARHG